MKKLFLFFIVNVLLATCSSKPRERNKDENVHNCDCKQLAYYYNYYFKPQLDTGNFFFDWDSYYIDNIQKKKIYTLNKRVECLIKVTQMEVKLVGTAYYFDTTHLSLLKKYLIKECPRSFKKYELAHKRTYYNIPVKDLEFEK